jgi:adenylate cyclase
MGEEILPPEKTDARRTAAARTDGRVEGNDHPSTPPPRARLRLPVGVALGLVFSLLLVAICGIIIAYMSAADRRIAGRLLDEQGVAVLKANEAVLDGFFREQELLFRSIAARVAETGERLGDADLLPYRDLLPDGARLELGAAANGVQAGAPSRPGWRTFHYREGVRTGVMAAEMDLGNGQRLTGLYPQPVFAGIARSMEWEGRQQVFLLAGRDRAIVIAGLPESAFAAQPDAPLPELAAMSGTPLRLIWQDQDRAHDMGGSVDGRVFPADRGMFTAIFKEVDGGPAAGWILGTLYRADEFGAALDQTQIVLYAALVALVVGAVLSFAVGRMLGRPLSRLAHAAAQMRTLDFAAADRLPRSRLAELDDVNQAFNGSLGALNAFAKYVPRQLVSRLIEEGMTSARNIEIKEMTIVFTDLAGFTDMASHMTAAETASYLNGYFETVSEAIAERDGTIDKFLGDGVMAFWGAPSDQPDHATRAISAVRALAERIDRMPGATMRVRIGVHTGKVVVGDIGSSARMNYTVIGDAVNVAARLQEHGKKVDPQAKVIALVSGETMAHLPEGTSATSLGSVQLRGRSEPLSVFRIA